MLSADTDFNSFFLATACFRPHAEGDCVQLTNVSTSISNIPSLFASFDAPITAIFDNQEQNPQKRKIVVNFLYSVSETMVLPPFLNNDDGSQMKVEFYELRHHIALLFELYEEAEIIGNSRLQHRYPRHGGSSAELNQACGRGKERKMRSASKMSPSILTENFDISDRGEIIRNSRSQHSNPIYGGLSSERNQTSGRGNVTGMIYRARMLISRRREFQRALGRNLQISDEEINNSLLLTIQAPEIAKQEPWEGLNTALEGLQITVSGNTKQNSKSAAPEGPTQRLAEDLHINNLLKSLSHISLNSKKPLS